MSQQLACIFLFRFGSLDLHTPEHQNGNHQKSENGFRERDLLSSASEENMFLDNQVKALEESKSLLTTEVLSEIDVIVTRWKISFY